MNETCSSMATPQDNTAASPQSESQNGEDNVGSESQSTAVPLKELEYGVMSFYAIVKPVFLTMVLTALSVTYISTPESKKQGEESLSNSYTVIQSNDEDTNGQKLGQSLVNGLVIVSVIGVATFMIVLLYKYRCMKIILGYMVLASVSLLGFLSSYMFEIAIERYNLQIDRLSFFITIYNFAVVGCAAIFFGKGIPIYVTQGYLIATSVIVAWQLSHFDPWTAWVLLVLLALYDLFAVLTPCGPLKALVKLLQKEDAPQLPGLLYEANIGQENRGRAEPTTGASTSNDTPSTPQTPEVTPQQTEELQVQSEVAAPSDDEQRTTSMNGDPSVSMEDDMPNEDPDINQSMSIDSWMLSPDVNLDNGDGNGFSSVNQSSMNVDTVAAGNTDIPSPPMSPRMGIIPRGIAVLYGLKILYPDYSPNFEFGEDWTAQELNEEVEVEFPIGWQIVRHTKQFEGKSTRFAVIGPGNKLACVLFVNQQGEVREDVRDKPRPRGRVPLALALLNKLPIRLRDEETPAEQPPDTANYTADQLREEVDVFFPRNGWRVEKHSVQHENEETRYAVIQPDGTVKRLLFISSEGKVFEDIREKNRQADEEAAEKDRTSIRLGLGDFIFYSILVSKAALYSSATFFACTISILVGLGLTLGILAVRGKALPALPISIFLGVLFYLLTRYSVQPWIQEIFIQHSYV